MNTIAPILIADGGSTDETVSLAAAGGARVLTSCARGRGSQIAAACDQLTSGWILVLHADTALNDKAKHAIEAFTDNPENQKRAAYLRFKLDDDGDKARRLEKIVAWRCNRFALPYGDQGFLIHKTLLDQLGGFKKIPLMEDVDMIWRLQKKLGRSALVELDGEAMTSAEKFLQSGYLKRSARNLFCLLMFRLKVPPHLIQKIY